MSTLESYFESLGRQSTKPYIDDSNLYLDTEPDNTKNVNENIDAEIIDTKQFFDDKIKMFNEMQKVGSLDARLQKLASLTQTGAPLLKGYLDHRKDLKSLDKLEKGETKAQFNFEGVDLQQKTNKNLVDLQAELGVAKREIEQNGFYVTTNADGEEVVIKTDQEWYDYAQMVQNLSTGNGRETADLADKYFSKYLEIAQTSMPHTNGRYFDELTFAEQQEWYRSVKAYYIRMWQDKDPRFSDGLVVRKLFKTFDDEEEKLFSGQLNQTSQAGEIVLSEGTRNEYISAIRQTGLNIREFDSYSAEGGQVFDQFLGENGVFQQRRAYYMELFDGDVDRVNDALKKELNAAIDYGLNDGSLNEDILDDVLTEWKVKSSDGRGYIPFKDLNKTTNEIAVAAEQAINDSYRTKNVVTMTAKLDKYREDLKVGRSMTQEQLYEYIPYPDLYQTALNIYNQGQKNGMSSDKFADVDTTLSEDVQEYTSNPKNFPNVKGSKLEQQRIATLNYNLIKPAVNKRFYYYYQLGMENYQNEAEAKKFALEKVNEELLAGKFNSATFEIDPELTYSAAETKNNASRMIETIRKDPEGWLDSTSPHKGESMNELLLARKFLESGGTVPVLYRELAKYFPDYMVENIIYRRLVANGMIDPNDSKFATYGLTTIPEASIMESRLLTDRPTFTNALEFSSANAESWAKALNMIKEPKALEYFNGVGAFKDNSGTYSDTVDVSQLALYNDELGKNDVTGDLLVELARANLDGEFGIYGLKGRDIIKLLEYLNDNNLLTGREVFDEKFQVKLLKYKMKLNANSQLAFLGDTSYLKMAEISEEDQELFNKLIGTDGKNIPIWSNLDFLLKTVMQYQVNTQL